MAHTGSDLPTVITVDDPNSRAELYENARVANGQAVSLKEIMEYEKVDNKRAELVSQIHRTDSLVFGYSIMEDSLLTYYTLRDDTELSKENPFKYGVAETEI